MSWAGMRIPWTEASVPHGTLDLLRGCNVSCPGCYNRHSPAVKPFQQIKDELRQMMTLRRVQTVSLLGGEPTLHPQLADIVRHIAAQGIRVLLFSNGVLLTRGLIRELRQAGCDLIYLHIQRDQRRPDLPARPSRHQLQALRRQKAELIAEHGVEVGLVTIGYKRALAEIYEIVGEVLDSPTMHFLTVIEYTNPSKFAGLTGDVRAGLSGPPMPHVRTGDEEEVVNQDITDMMEQRGMHPFAYLGSTTDEDEPRWLFYRVGVVRPEVGGASAVSLEAGLSDRLLFQLPYWVTGRHVFFHRASPAVYRWQLLFNALSGGRCWKGLRLLAESCRPGAKLESKYLLFQQGPTLRADGTVVFCRYCPDATVRNGRLVPVCLADRMREGQPDLPEVPLIVG